MSVEQVERQLEAMGHAKVRAQNIRHGADAAQFGVRLGDIRKLATKLKPNHVLALELWDTGNLDAQLLAVLLMQPASLSSEELDELVRSATVPQLADWLNAYVVKEHAEKEALRLQWMAAPDPWAARAGWNLTSARINKAREGLDLSALLDRIEAELAHAHPATQWTMNNCLAGIGIHVAELRERALAIGERLGVYRDYPVSKGCTSPFAPIWIHAMVKRP